MCMASPTRPSNGNTCQWWSLLAKRSPEEAAAPQTKTPAKRRALESSQA